MSRFVMDFQCNNAAFSDDPRQEVARILRETADKLEGGREGGHCFDVNGNRVGNWDLEIEEEDE